MSLKTEKSLLGGPSEGGEKTKLGAFWSFGSWKTALKAPGEQFVREHRRPLKGPVHLRDRTDNGYGQTSTSLTPGTATPDAWTNR